MTTTTEALEAALHELESMHGLVACDGEAPEEKWEIDTSVAAARVREALAGEKLAARIEAAFDEAKGCREVMLDAARNLEEMRAMAKLEHADEWAGAKNNDVRAVMLAGWCEEEEGYGKNVVEYQEGRDGYKLALLEIERLKLLVAAGRAA